jgi:HAD superfamily hydrolase (TIGR01490 family)
MNAAFFDLDHTILSISSGQIMFESSRRHGIISRGQAFLALGIVVLYRAGLISPDRAINRWMSWYAGMSEDEIAPIAAEWAEELKRYVRGDARREVDLHRAGGVRTVVLSASTTFFCETIRAELGMDDVICSEVEVADGRLTGALKGRYCYGVEKLNRAKAYCSEHGINMAGSWYYADSIADAPVMEAVGHPVCVTPDPKLEREARKRGWEIRMWR